MSKENERQSLTIADCKALFDYALTKAMNIRRAAESQNMLVSAKQQALNQAKALEEKARGLAKMMDSQLETLMFVRQKENTNQPPPAREKK